ncbi:calcium-binding and coiled-coil domain-containing protein 1 isoform X1 [Syngnathus acus]|uniref:calcium-binding and coiled-coil domain-containing protein 1 isoform X1 n=1 Tax=Syngnathus acus TaxID=161584 RepID=UPI001886293D|nr:calcium-binding and coiled-coil domain-containing protein 1 isoform X1 [Syngnathus acus]
METEAAVEFRNVARSYFPQSRVDCHYTLSAGHTWTSGDWVGLFKAGWPSTKDYQTFVWAPAPADCQELTEVNCCVQFQASYLPRPSGQEYEFVYVAANGEDYFRSSRFTFCTPKPLDDLVTLEEEPHGEGDSTDILLVVPRAELLKRQLRECLREQAELLRMQEQAKEQKEKERRDFNRERLAWSRLRGELHSDISGLQDELRRSQEKIEELEGWQKEETALGECLAQEKRALVEGREANRLQIEQLQEDIKTLTQRALQGETELERIKESAKRTAEEEETDRQILQSMLEQTQGDLRSLSKEFRELRTSLAQRDTSALQLQNTISSLSQKLSAAHRKEALNEATLKEMRSLQERLDASERAADVLKNDLSSTAGQRDRGQTEVHQARLQAAQLTLQLADCSLALREGRAQWAQEKQSLQRKAEKAREDLENLTAEMHTIEEKLQEERTERVKLEVELGREKDCNRVQVSELRRELQELKSSLRVKEKEHLRLETKDLMDYSCQLEQKMGTAAGAKRSAASTGGASSDDQWASRPSGLTGPPGTPVASVISQQPAPLSSPHEPGDSSGPRKNPVAQEEQSSVRITRTQSK